MTGSGLTIKVNSGTVNVLQKRYIKRRRDTFFLLTVKETVKQFSCVKPGFTLKA